jgi:hypothetical protein
MRVLAGTIAALALLAPQAHALGLGIGTPPGALTPFRPDATATASGTMLITGALGSWTLTITDGTAGTTSPGHLKRGAVCTSGVAYLGSPLLVTATALIGSATSAGPKSLSGTAQAVASGPATAATTLTTAFSQPIAADEVLQQGCAYTATVTFTLT